MDLKELISRFRNAGVVDDEEIYEIVGLEVESGERRTGLWTKALAETGWDEKMAKARYVKLRVEQIKSSIENERHFENLSLEDMPEEVFDYLVIPIGFKRYLIKYGVSEKKLEEGIANGKVRAYRTSRNLWIEDRPLK